MQKDAKKTIGELAERLWAFPIEEYLSSGDFLRFCREHDLGDAWREYPGLSRDRPDLYGSLVGQHALVLFLLHIFHSRQDEFPALFTGLIGDFSRGISCALPLDDLKADLVRLGYSEQETEQEFSRAHAGETGSPESRDGCSPG